MIQNSFSCTESYQKNFASFINQFSRTEGKRWLLPIHEHLHVANNIQFYGAHNNIHTKPLGHIHISNAKKPSNQVQRGTTTKWQLKIHLSNQFITSSRNNKVIFSDDALDPNSLLVYKKCATTSQNACRFDFIIGQRHNGIHVDCNCSLRTKTQTTFWCLIQTINDHFFQQMFPIYYFLLYKNNIWKKHKLNRQSSQVGQELVLQCYGYQKNKETDKLHMIEIIRWKVLHLYQLNCCCLPNFKSEPAYYSLTQSSYYKNKKLSILLS